MSLRLISDTSIWPTGVTVGPLDQTYSLAGISPFTSQIALAPLNRDNDIELFAFRDDVTTLFHIDPLSNAITASPLGTDGLNGIICQDVQLAHYDADGYPEIVCLEADGSLRGLRTTAAVILAPFPHSRRNRPATLPSRGVQIRVPLVEPSFGADGTSTPTAHSPRMRPNPRVFSVNSQPTRAFLGSSSREPRRNAATPVASSSKGVMTTTRMGHSKPRRHSLATISVMGYTDSRHWSEQPPHPRRRMSSRWHAL